ncbi:MAG: hypothetical protein ACK5Q5_00225 [Planctomycetaceae bacterium]
MLRTWYVSLPAMICCLCLTTVTEARSPRRAPDPDRSSHRDRDEKPSHCDDHPHRDDHRFAGPRDVDVYFRQMDANGDGSLSRREFARAHRELMNRIRTRFPKGRPDGHFRAIESGSLFQREPSRLMAHSGRPPFRAQDDRFDDHGHDGHRQARRHDDGDHDGHRQARREDRDDRVHHWGRHDRDDNDDDRRVRRSEHFEFSRGNPAAGDRDRQVSSHEADHDWPSSSRRIAFNDHRRSHDDFDKDDVANHREPSLSSHRRDDAREHAKSADRKSDRDDE